MENSIKTLKMDQSDPRAERIALMIEHDLEIGLSDWDYMKKLLTHLYNNHRNPDMVDARANNVIKPSQFQHKGHTNW